MTPSKTFRCGRCGHDWPRDHLRYFENHAECPDCSTGGKGPNILDTSLYRYLPLDLNCPLCNSLSVRTRNVFECSECGVKMTVTKIRPWLKWLDRWMNDGGETR